MSASPTHPRVRQVVIVGGGFSGATFAVQLVRKTPIPVAIFIVEPREHLGHGLAYSATDPDHRLNNPLDVHAIDPDHPGELKQWCMDTGALERDPEAVLPSGHIFLRRAELGAYLSEQVSRHANDERSGCTISHIRDSAVGLSAGAYRYSVLTETGRELRADAVVVATGNPVPSLRAPFASEHAQHPRIVPNPLATGALDAIPRDARVLVVGGGLTALDIVSTLVRRGHAEKILVLSRRGLRPRPHSADIVSKQPAQSAVPSGKPLELIFAPIPEFIDSQPASVRQWCRSMRSRIADAQAAGVDWREPFDLVRNVVWKVWPRLPEVEQHRFLRRLRVFYDAHRFRAPPMNDEMVQRAESEGFVQYAAAKVSAVHAASASEPVAVELIPAGSSTPQRHEFDYVVNCTGLDSASGWKANAFLASLVAQGYLKPHATQLGFEVSEDCEAIDASGTVQDALRVIGPPTAGAFGDPLGILFIAAQVNRMLASFLNTLMQQPHTEAIKGK